MRNTFEAEGEVRGTDLLGALVSLWRQGASGSLQFSRSGATAGFDLSGGEIVGVSASEARFETAAILVRAGKLEAATLERLSTPEGSDRALTALQAGVLTKREWRWGEKIRAVEVLSDLLTWLEGDYSFFRAPIRDGGEFRLTIPRLVLELFLRSRDRNLVLHYIGGVDVPLSRSRGFDAEFATFGLTADAESVVRLIDGHSTAAEISAEAPAEPFAVEKLLAALVTLGLIQPEFGATQDEAVFPVAIREAGEASPLELEEPQEPEEQPAGTDEEQAEEQEEEEEEEREEKHQEEDEGEPPAYQNVEEEPATVSELPAEEPHPEPEPQPEGEPPREQAQDVPIEMHAESEPIEDFRSDGIPADFDAERAIPGDFANGEHDDQDAGERPLDMTTGIGAEERPRHRSGAPLLWLLALLAAGVAIVLVLRGRGSPPPPEPAAALAAAVPTAFAAEPTASFPTAAATTPAPGLAPAATLAVSATRVPAAAAPRPTAVPPAPAPREAGVTGNQRSRRYWVDRAARDRKRSNADRGARYTIQLELACEVESLVDAWKHDRPAGTMWVLATPFGGRTCFRVLWGRYATREAAQRALAAAPGFFSTPRNHPLVVPIR